MRVADELASHLGSNRRRVRQLQRHVVRPTSYPVPRFHDDDVESGRLEPARGCQAGQPRADHGDVAASSTVISRRHCSGVPGPSCGMHTCLVHRS
jgi:hypothetical protein